MRGWLIRLLGGHTGADVAGRERIAHDTGVRSMVHEMGRREDAARRVLFQAGRQYSRDRINQLRQLGPSSRAGLNPNIVAEGDELNIGPGWRDRV